MGLFDAVKAATSGNKAYRTHVNGNELANSGKPEEAKAKYQEALKLYEESIRLGNVAAKILEGYAILLLREGEFDKARDLMQRMAKMKTLTKDDWFQLRIQYAIWEWKVGELDKAIETIGRAADYKLNGTVYSTLGMFWVDKAKQTGDFKPALDFNERALDYDDEDAATLDNMGQLYEAMAGAEGEGEKAADYRAKALDFFKRAHKQKPRQITTLYYLARMYHQNGDDKRARELLSIRNTLYFSAICPVTRQQMEALAQEAGC
ncbi:MAG: tetratricopeptide repeat protein [Clostridia bacterium]|nr:tetratricopeptide repeat protein [Clostridia bacterium]